ncbi:MAG: hypothetical protein IJ220_02135 [Clostridia bacterium]|nr:hypothetical protein [Clostridia bacterium]
MKKIFLIVAMISVIVLVGCSNKKVNETNNEVILNEQEDTSFNVKDYAGQWKSSDETYEANYVTINAMDTNIINFEYMMVSDAPYYMVASINVENVIIDENGIGEFEFEEDGWNHKGKGIIKLTSDGVEIEIQKIEYNAEVEEESEWKISSGKYEKRVAEE